MLSLFQQCQVNQFQQVGSCSGVGDVVRTPVAFNGVELTGIPDLVRQESQLSLVELPGQHGLAEQ